MVNKDMTGGWAETAAQHSRNEDYYSGLVDQVASHIGPQAYVCDDGSISESPVRAKVPEMVAALVASRDDLVSERNEARSALAEVRAAYPEAFDCGAFVGREAATKANSARIIVAVAAWLRRHDKGQDAYWLAAEVEEEGSTMLLAMIEGRE